MIITGAFAQASKRLRSEQADHHPFGASKGPSTAFGHPSLD
jgi:hypothetical protein